MNLAQVSRLLAGFTLFFCIFLTIPLVVAGFEDQAEHLTLMGFSTAMAVGLGTAFLLWLGGRSARVEFFRREGFAVVGFSWLLAGILGAIPFAWSHAIPSPADAFFETVSGLTTTGATVLGIGDNPLIESLPKSILLWRSMLQWMGGLGIILVFIVLLPAMGVTGMNLLVSEQVGVSQQNLRPRMQEQARALFAVYAFLTLAAGVLYHLAGMTGFEALCHAFTTMATGGFSTKNYSIGAFQNLPIEVICTGFMFLAGCNFALLISVAKGRFLRWKTLGSNPEFRLYLGFTLFMVLALTLILWIKGGTLVDEGLGIMRNYDSFGRCLRDGSFQAVSILTSTGYSTADFQNWANPALYLLVLCMLVGGSTGSTAGGLKIVRMLVCGKLVAFTVRAFVQPKRVEKIRIGEEVMPNHVISAILGLVLLWVGSILLGALFLSLDPRVDLVSALSASASMMGCTGPAVTPEVGLEGVNLGPYGGFGLLSIPSKIFMAFQMILGRLELMVPLVLIIPGFWRR